METANTSNQIQTFRGLSWDEPLTQGLIEEIEKRFGPLANTLIELAGLVGEIMQWRVEPYPDRDLPYKMVKMAAIEIRKDEFLSVPCDVYNLVVRVLASAKKLHPKIEMVIGQQQAEEFYYKLVSTFGLVYGNFRGITQSPPNETLLPVGFRVDESGICEGKGILAKLKDWHSAFLLMAEKDTETCTHSIAQKPTGVTMQKKRNIITPGVKKYFQSLLEIRDYIIKYKIQQWDQSVSVEEQIFVEEYYGPLAKSIKELAELIQEIIYCCKPQLSPNEICKIKVLTGPGPQYDKEIPMSKAAVALVLRAHTSARKLRLKIEQVVGPEEAGKFYHKMRETLRYAFDYSSDSETGKLKQRAVWLGSHGRAESIVRRLEQWNDRSLLLAKQDSGKAETKTEPADEEKTTHSIDFRSVCWYGTDYNFTPNQAAAIKILWENWEKGTPDVGGDTLSTEIESDSKRARDIFKGNPAFRTMIRQGKTKGTYRLAEPDK